MGGKRSIRNKVIWGKLLFVADRKGAKEASFNGYLSSETFSLVLEKETFPIQDLDPIL